jgi:opacity protein-like surface antigen
MKRLIFGAVVAFVLLVGSMAVAQEFKGLYLGGYAGGVVGRADAQTSTIDTGFPFMTDVINANGAQEVNGSGFHGGGTFGYNFQGSGGWLFGVETDIGAMHLDPTTTSTVDFPVPGTFTLTQNVHTNWLFTARPRVGYAFKKVLFYVTGGVAVTGLNYNAVYSDTIPAPFGPGTESGGTDGTKAGYVAGGGIEGKASQHWSVKGEYLYAHFGYTTQTSTNFTLAGVPTPAQVFTHHANLFGHIIRVGINYHFGGTPPPAPTASCFVQPSAVFAGETVHATVTPGGFNPKHSVDINWSATGGVKAEGKETVNVDTKGLNPGSYTLTANASDPKDKKATASCNTTFTVKERPKNPPQASCSANPSTVESGTPSTITCTCNSPDNSADNPVTTSFTNWSSSAGRVSGSGNSGTLDTAGAYPGPITVTATCTDSRNLTGNGTANVNVENPPAPPQASKLNECSYVNKAKPARVDNACKAALDDYALRLQRDADAKGVIVGNQGATEKNVAGQRSANVKDYMVKEKGIDPARIETRTGSTDAASTEQWIVPAGATFSEAGTAVSAEQATPAKKAAKKPAAATPKP